MTKPWMVLAALVFCAGGLQADYATERRALGGAAVHDTIASADSCEVSRIQGVSLDGEPRFEVVDGPIVAGGEAKHLLTQTIGTAALRGHRPEKPGAPTHLVRFKRGRRVVDVFVSIDDGSFRVVRSARVVATLGEARDSEHWAKLLGRTLRSKH